MELKWLKTDMNAIHVYEFRQAHMELKLLKTDMNTRCEFRQATMSYKRSC